MIAPFRITIEGVADTVFLAAILEDVKKITPENGGFTFHYGSTATQHDGDDREDW